MNSTVIEGEGKGKGKRKRKTEGKGKKKEKVTLSSLCNPEKSSPSHSEDEQK